MAKRASAWPSVAQHGFIVAEVMLSVLTCLQFHVYPMRQFVAWNVRKLRGRNASDGDKTDVSCYGLSMTRWYDIIGALGCSAGFCMIAMLGRPDNETILKERIASQYFVDL